MAKNKNKWNTVIDIILFLLMISIFMLKGEWHETIAYSLGILLIIHLILHWPQFKTMYKQLIPVVIYQKIGTVIITLLVVALLAAPFYITPDKRGGHHGPPPAYGQYH